MMATLKPFRGLRYNPGKVSISQVIAPPYDVITEGERDELYRLSDYNVVRLILGKETPQDNEAANCYTRSRSFLEQWIREGILVRDEKPSFYLYDQEFEHPEMASKMVRRALVALVRLEKFGEGAVFPHEKTYARPKADRLRLLNETRANLSPVFGLYEDVRNEVNTLLSNHSTGKPLAEGRDRQGIGHRMWRIEDETTLRAIVEAFRGKKIVLADGHHRYETALNHSRLGPRACPGDLSRSGPFTAPSGGTRVPVGTDGTHGAGEWRRSDTERYDRNHRVEPSLDREGVPNRDREGNPSPCDFVMISLVSASDPGLVVLPTHRLVKTLKDFSPTNFIGDLNSHCELRQMERGKILTELNGYGQEERVFGVYLGSGKAYVARVRSLDQVVALRPQGKSREWAALEVSILAYWVLEKVLGLPESVWEDNLAYTRSESEALRKVDSGESSLALLVRSMPVSEVQKVSESSELLPHKSTYFFPKLASGLLFYEHTPLV